MKIHEKIYSRLMQIIDLDELRKDGHLKYSNGMKGFMPLNIDLLHEDKDQIIIALAHNFTQNGDLICDPDMQIRIYPEMKMAEALTFQQDTYPPYYEEVYPIVNNVKSINHTAKKKQNSFLNQWLTNIKNQNYSLQS